MSSSFEEKVRQLSQAIEDGKHKINASDQCFPTAIAIGSVVPFATMLLLFLTRPSFVKKYEGNKQVLSVHKLFWRTIAITFFIWLCMYFFNMYNGFDKLAMMCVV